MTIRTLHIMSNKSAAPKPKHDVKTSASAKGATAHRVQRDRRTPAQKVLEGSLEVAVPTLPSQYANYLVKQKGGLSKIEVHFYPSGLNVMHMFIGTDTRSRNVQEYAEILNAENALDKKASDARAAQAVISKLRERLAIVLPKIDDDAAMQIMLNHMKDIERLAGGIIKLSQTEFAKKYPNHETKIIHLKRHVQQVQEFFSKIPEFSSLVYNPVSKSERISRKAQTVDADQLLKRIFNGEITPEQAKIIAEKSKEVSEKKKSSKTSQQENPKLEPNVVGSNGNLVEESKSTGSASRVSSVISSLTGRSSRSNLPSVKEQTKE